MRNNTRRALRATATVAGVAALAGTFAGTAFADSGLGGLGGSDNNYGDSDSTQSLSNLGDSDSGSVFDEPGLGNFEMPSTGVGSRGMRTDGIPLLDALDGGDEDSDGDNMPQHPVDNEGGNFAKNISFLGHDSNASWGGGKSIGSRDFRTSGPFDDFGGGDSDFGDGGSSGIHKDSIFSHNDEGTSSYNDGDDDNSGDSWDSDDSHGLSGHHLKLPIG